jgi:hypothetical protein
LNVEDTLREGIEAAQSGKTLRARTLLSKVVLEMPTSVEAWWWLGQSVQDPRQREYCFRKVVEIDPSHETARGELGMAPAPTQSEIKAAAARSRKTTRRGMNRGRQRLIIFILVLGVILIAIGGGVYIALDSLGFLDEALAGDFSFIGAIVPVAQEPTPTTVVIQPTPTFASVSLASIPTWTATPSPTPRPATPTATHTPQGQADGTSTMIPPTPEFLPEVGDAETVQLTTGTGFLTLVQNEFYNFRFEPEVPFQIQTVGSLTFHALDDLDSPLSVELYIWNLDTSSWSVLGVLPGDTIIVPATIFVDPQGVIIAALRNWGPVPVDFTNAGFTFNGRLVDGSEISYGLMRQEIRPPATATATAKFEE